MRERAPSWWRRLARGLRARRGQVTGGTSPALRQFRAEVEAAVAGGADRGRLDGLLGRPRDLGLPEEEVELELEMLHGSLDLLDLQDRVASAGLPIVAHQHKALGDERCHFLASAFLASDAGQQTGRLCLTERRLVFVASPVIALPWGAVARLLEEGRDLVVAAPGRGVVHRFRCNSFSDLRCGGWIAERLRAELKEGGRAS